MFKSVIDLMVGHKKAYELAHNLDDIDPRYHQEIADKAIDEGSFYAILTHSYIHYTNK